MYDYIYDLETYPNIFTCAIRLANSDTRWLFEISDRRDDRAELMTLLNGMKANKSRMFGFNNIGFDYPVLHLFINMWRTAQASDMYAKAQAIIDNYENRFAHLVWESDHYVQQVDLFKIHHFDNRAKSVSLKVLEFNLRTGNIKDLPYAPGTRLTHEAMDELCYYNMHDVDCTHDFYLQSKSEIEFRETLAQKYGTRWMNFNDKKIGVQYFIDRLEDSAPGSCYERIDGKKKMKQTPRDHINLGSVIFDYVQFERPELQRIHDFFNKTTIQETKKDSLGKLEATVDGFTYTFGVGGLHGSVSSQTVVADDDHAIIDLDVTSYYPSLGIVNRLRPAHLPDLFCDIYGDLKTQRITYKKGTVENLMLKLALNGSYGETNSVYSPLYDPLYTMAITINGQLLLCMLAEKLIKAPGLKMIQANTDGVTIKTPRQHLEYVEKVKKWWEGLTGLELEQAEYSRMFIRDVNNYIAEYTDGKLKNKGAYEYNLEWHKDHSALVVPKAVEEYLTKGTPVRDFILNHDDAFDFMLRVKVPRSSSLVISEPCPFYWNELADEYSIDPACKNNPEWEDVTSGLKKHIKIAHDKGVDAYNDRTIQNITRFYVSNNGGYLFKIMPPLKGKTLPRRLAQVKGWTVRECNDIKDANPFDINYNYYIEEAEKLIAPLR